MFDTSLTHAETWLKHVVQGSLDEVHDGLCTLNALINAPPRVARVARGERLIMTQIMSKICTKNV